MSATTRGSAPEPTGHDWIMRETERLKALGETERRAARDPVSQPIINAWLDAMEETDPRFTRGVAPAAMAQVWTMPGLRGTRGPGDPLSGAMEVLDAAGYTSVLGTNCDQTYERYLRVGEQVSVTTRLVDVVGPKKTGVGEGYFVTTRNVWRVGDEVVATMQFRVLKFVPRDGGRAATPRDGGRAATPRDGGRAASPRDGGRAATPRDGGRAASEASDQSRPDQSRPDQSGPQGPDRSKIIRPVRNQDTEFFWEGTRRGELRLQRCNACGELRHPPGPVCPTCHALDRGYVVASGRGTIFSFLVHHAPQMPGRVLPVTIALVELEESRQARSPIRFVADVRGDSDDLAIGDSVVVGWDQVDDELTLPIWELAR